MVIQNINNYLTKKEYYLLIKLLQVFDRGFHSLSKKHQMIPDLFLKSIPPIRVRLQFSHDISIAGNFPEYCACPWFNMHFYEGREPNQEHSYTTYHPGHIPNICTVGVISY